MNILLLGGGGREHALAWKLAQSPSLKTLYAAPGNPGIAQHATLVDLDAADHRAVVDFCIRHSIGLVVIGPEAPLVDGLADNLRIMGVPVFGPNKKPAQLEGSKGFTKDLCKRANIPTAAYVRVTSKDGAIAALDDFALPVVIKADGLAAGKGVIVAETLEQAEDAVRDMLSGNAFGDAGCRVVIEEFLVGEEASFIVMVDGEDVLPMATSQDHKRVGDGDTGPNTGGMGAYSPATVGTPDVHQRIMEQVIMPTVRGMAEEGNRYTGFLYAGLMISPEGEPKVIEYNCRFGDPETQPIMLRLQSDLVALCQAALAGTLANAEAQWDARPAVGVVLAAGGYPGSYKKGDEITGIPAETASTKVFHAGTQLDGGRLTTNGGRVLCATAMGNSVSEAQALAYDVAKQIDWQGVFFRSDIAYRAIARE